MAYIGQTPTKVPLTSTDITDGTIGLADMAANSIDSDQYVDGSIDNAHLADDAVDSDELAAGAVDLAHMSAESVDSDQYVDGSIDTIHIGNDQVTGAKLNPALVAGDIIYADGTDTINRLAKPGTPANEVLTFATSATAPSWVAPAGGGKVLAVVQATKTDTVSTTSTTAVTTGLAVTTGTLASTSSRVLVMVSINIGNDTSEQRTHVTLWDADGQLFLGDSGTGHQVTSWMRSMDPYSMYNFAFNYVDSPSATLAQVYTVKFHITGVQTAWVNRANGEDSNSGRCASSIIAIEIGA